MANPQHPQSASLGTRLSRDNKPTVIGIYGVPACGKSFLIKKLEENFRDEPFAFFEGSEVIAELISPGGLEVFKELPPNIQDHYRQLAISKIQIACINIAQTGVVAGHYMFWDESEATGRPVITQADLNIYTHILYLEVPSDEIVRQREEDTERNRQPVTVAHIQKWQQEEKSQLRELCRQHEILFSVVSRSRISDNEHLVAKVSTLVRDFREHNEHWNLSRAKADLDEALSALTGELRTVLLLDADRTLSSEDTGKIFWEKVAVFGQGGDEDPLKSLFSSPPNYSYDTFRQATLLYEELENREFDDYCQEVASDVAMYPEFVGLLDQAQNNPHTGVVVVTCGIRRVWERILEFHGLFDRIKVIGGGRLSDGYVVTPIVKREFVAYLQDVYGLNVWAFGDSALDLEMLRKADQAIVVVGDERARSKSMDGVLANAITNERLRARQVLLPSSVQPRLDTDRLPITYLADPEFLNSLFSPRDPQVFHATDRHAAKLLVTHMRDATNKGPSLREAHHRAGFYLAIELVGSVIDLEEYQIPHVQGHSTAGHRLLAEEQTLIVALMRGGEPMAFGVNEAFPLAIFLHAKRPGDITGAHLEGIVNIFLVDSVVNTGKSVMEFVDHIRKFHDTVRVVIVAGVVQAQATSGGRLKRMLGNDTNLSLLALRLSENKFTGRGGTDTGNRLFNTTHLL